MSIRNKVTLIGQTGKEVEVISSEKGLIAKVSLATNDYYTNAQGEKIEVGSIVKDLMDKGVEASLVPKLSFEKQDRKSEEKIYLQID